MFVFKKYLPEDEAKWDAFVSQSWNGTFLQTKRFLNYHSPNHFIDASLLCFDKKGNLAAVIPACVIESSGSRKFVSHAGATFGGVVLDEKHYYADAVITLLQELEIFLKGQGYNEVIIKQTPEIYCQKSGSLLEYSLFYLGYEQCIELNTYIDFDQYNSDILSNFNTAQRRHLRRIRQKHLSFSAFESEQQIEEFYRVLCCNLQKFKAKPVHELNELIELKKCRLKEQMIFMGVYNEQSLLAGCMVFLFEKTKVAHTQYLAMDYDKDPDAMKYLYYNLIKWASSKEYKKLSWGISTEDDGKYLNMGLIRNKESYGSTYSLNKKFHKII